MKNDDSVSIFGVRITNFSTGEAIDLMQQMLIDNSDKYSIYIANAHTLNLAGDDKNYQALLNRASRVFADGTGARWAARVRGVRLKENLVGTDLIPNLFEATAGKGYRFYLLGGTPENVNRAANTCRRLYPGWELVGFQHGYLNEEETAQAIDEINALRPNILLVAMGNPYQEQWIDKNRARLTIPLCIGIGGLVNYWAGAMKRAPMWVRKQGFEWAKILLQQPHKWRRYLLGNPKFLVRIVLELSRDKRLALSQVPMADSKAD
ncbi:MAG: WecB/TagA/CpsF family glycosyltransferase [Pseudomonadota bacterium]